MKNVMILGLAASWKLAPLEGECWGITGTVTARRVDRVFDMHEVTWDKEHWLEHYRTWIGPYKTDQQMIDKAVIRWHGMQHELEVVKKLGVPFYSVRTYPDMPSSVAYPIKEVVAHFDDDYFSSSFDYAIALAIYEEYDRIDIYGCNMSASDEYVYQRPSFSYWLGIAKGLGIAFKVHGNTELMKTSRNLMYGYNTPRREPNVQVCSVD